MKKRIIGMLIALVLVLAACSSGSANKIDGKDAKVEGEKIKVVASFFPIADLSEKIGGDHVEVKNLVKNGSAHGYEPSVGDMKDIAEADLLIINGAGFEGWVEKVKANNPDLQILDLSEGIDLIKNTEEMDDHDHGPNDPHIWLSLDNLEEMAENIYTKLAKIDSKNKDAYEMNYKNLENKLNELEDKYNDAFEKHKGKSIIVPHEAFAYLVKDLGIKQIGLEGINSDSEPTLTKIAEVSKIMKDNNITTVFYDLGKSDKAAQTIAKETGAKVKDISTLEVITDQDIKEGKDLLSLMEMNLQNILDSFEGK